MNKDSKKGATTNTPKRLTVQDLKKILGGLGGGVVPHDVEDNKGSKASPSFTDQE
jgi:hypothetical protein